MKRILRYILLLAIATIAGRSAASTADLVAEADSAYNSLAYSRALELYMLAGDSLGTSSDLFYNIGNTHYRMGDLGRAVLWYERALKLDPTNEDAKTNLDFVNARITDKPVDNRLLLAKIFDNTVNFTHPDTWAWTAFILFTLTVIAFVGYLVTRNVVIRKICFFGGGVVLLLMIVTVTLSLTGSRRSASHDMAIITSPSAKLSTAPREATDNESQAFLLHEGTKVEVVDSVIPTHGKGDRWYEVKVAGSRAWIKGTDMERI
ncbi:MAG: tetratricopeptide repeat protein [Clostridiales bacterium]|nr:tetratricopeptide repeat protein [Clostridiales bacterium]